MMTGSICDRLPVKLWELYIQLTQVEEAFKNIKGDPFGCAQGARWPSDPSTISAKTAARPIC